MHSSLALVKLVFLAYLITNIGDPGFITSRWVRTDFEQIFNKYRIIEHKGILVRQWIPYRHSAPLIAYHENLNYKINSSEYMKKELLFYLNSSQVLSVTGVFDLADCEWPRQLLRNFRQHVRLDCPSWSKVRSFWCFDRCWRIPDQKRTKVSKRCIFKWEFISVLEW